MRAGIVFAPVRPARRTATCIATVATLALGTSVAFAQQPQPIQPVPAPKASPRPVQPAQKAPAKQPQQPAQAPAAPGGEQQAQADQPPVVYSPWTKFCGKDQKQADAKQVCLTVKEARLETGQFVAGAAVIEQEGQDRKLLRITLPLGMQLPQGSRIVLDKEQPVGGQFVVCLPNGCMADFQITKEFVDKLKKGTTLVLQGINLPGQAVSYPLPLGDFAKANDGPPTDPKVFQAEQQKLQEELQKRAEEARKKLLEKQQEALKPNATPPAKK